MKTKFSRAALAVAVAAALGIQAPLARAEIVSTESIVAQSQLDSDRAKVQAFLDRASVKDRMQTLGVDGVLASERVKAMSDEEVHTMAQKIDALPAGGAFSQNELIIILLIAILVVIAI